MSQAKSKYSRILVKLSGEALLGDRQYGVDPDKYKAAKGHRIFITETGAKWDKQMDWLEDGVPDYLARLHGAP